jgi:hypothetical protein
VELHSESEQTEEKEALSALSYRNAMKDQQVCVLYQSRRENLNKEDEYTASYVLRFLLTQ